MEWYRPAPSSVLVVDANIILSEVLGRRLRLVFQTVVANRTEVTSAHAADEVGDVARGAPGLPRGGTGELVKALLGGLDVVDEAVYGDLWTHDRNFVGTGRPAVVVQCKPERQSDYRSDLRAEPGRSRTSRH
jgi:hypothetical protein